jgi:hypothetical protein
VDALAQLLIEKGFITQDEFFTRLNIRANKMLKKIISLVCIIIVTGCSSAPFSYRSPTRLNNYYCHETLNHKTISEGRIAIAGVFIRDEWTGALAFDYEFNDMLVKAIDIEHPSYNLRQVIPQVMEVSPGHDTFSLQEKTPLKFFEPSLLGLFESEEIYLRYLVFVIITRNTKEQFEKSKNDDDCFYTQRQIDLVAQVYDNHTKAVAWQGEFRKDITNGRCVSKCDSDAEGFIEKILDELFCELTRKTYLDPPPVASVLVPILKEIAGRLPYERID